MARADRSFDWIAALALALGAVVLVPSLIAVAVAVGAVVVSLF